MYKLMNTHSYAYMEYRTLQPLQGMHTLQLVSIECVSEYSGHSDYWKDPDPAHNLFANNIMK